MNGFIIFCFGAFAATITEVFWKGGSRRSMAIWGGAGMLLLRRVVLRFSSESRALLCIVGALLLFALHVTFLLLQRLSKRTETGTIDPEADTLSFSYTLYRFLLIAPAYTIIEYLETRFGM